MNLNIGVLAGEEIFIGPRIAVIGVGGAGCNVVRDMARAGMPGAVKLIAANTDAQSLVGCGCPYKLQLGTHTTRGLGAGGAPDAGARAARESEEEIIAQLQDTDMIVIVAGLGGGTGTGAAPVIAGYVRRIKEECGVPVVFGIVTLPFEFEGRHRMKIALSGLHELEQNVDTILVIANQKLEDACGTRTLFSDAFGIINNFVALCVSGMVNAMVKPGIVNVDYADVRAILERGGYAIVGVGVSSGEDRAITAASGAMVNPLLGLRPTISGALGVLVNITGGDDITLSEIYVVVNKIREEVDPQCNIIFGAAVEEGMQGTLMVTIIATGVEPDKVEVGQLLKDGDLSLRLGQSFRSVDDVVNQRQPQAQPSQQTAGVIDALTRAKNASGIGGAAQATASRTGNGILSTGSALQPQQEPASPTAMPKHIRDFGNTKNDVSTTKQPEVGRDWFTFLKKFAINNKPQSPHAVHTKIGNNSGSKISGNSSDFEIPAYLRRGDRGGD